MAVFSGNGSAASPSFTFSSDTDTGIYLHAANTLNVTTGGTERATATTTGIVINELGNDYDFRVEGDTDTNLFNCDAGLDVVSIGAAGSSSDGKLSVFKTVTAATAISATSSHITLRGGVAGTNHRAAVLFNPLNSSGNGSPAAIVGIASGNSNSSLAFYTNGTSNFGSTPNNFAVKIDDAGDILMGGDVAGGNPQYRYDESANRHLINAADGTQASAGGTARLVTRAGGLRIQGASNGVGAWEVVPFSLAASASATNIMSIDTSLTSSSSLLYGFSGFLSIQAGWVGATNNGNRVRLYYFTQIQGNFSATELDAKSAGSASDYTLTTTDSTGDRFFQLANNSASYTMQGSMAILLLGGTASTFAITDRLN